jgi:DNA-binding transcriptional ArsR family regulator
MKLSGNEREKLRIKAEVFKALGSPVRLAILDYLRLGERCVCEITEYIGTDVSNVSKHLSLLRRQGLVTDRREGLKIFYRIVMPCAEDFTNCVEGVILARLERQRGALEA